MTTSAFPALTEAEQVFKDLLWTPMITAGENWLEVEVPFLELPVIKQLDEAVINEITDALFNYVILVIDVTAIKLVNTIHQSAYDTASLKLRVIAQNEGINSDAYKQAREAELAAQSTWTNIAAGQSG